MMLIGQLIWIVTPRKEEKSNTYTYYKLARDQSKSGGHYHQIIFFCFCSGTNIDQANCLFCVIQSSVPNTDLFNILFNAIENNVFIIGSIIAIVNTDPIEDSMNGVSIIFSNEQ